MENRIKHRFIFVLYYLLFISDNELLIGSTKVQELFARRIISVQCVYCTIHAMRKDPEIFLDGILNISVNLFNR